MKEPTHYQSRQVPKGERGQVVSFAHTMSDGTVGKAYGVVLALGSECAKVAVCYRPQRLAYTHSYDALYAVPYADIIECLARDYFRS